MARRNEEVEAVGLPLPYLSHVIVDNRGGVLEQVLEMAKAWRLRPRQRAWLVVIARAGIG